MKKFISMFFLLFFAPFVLAWTNTVIVGGGVPEAGAPTPLCTETFSLAGPEDDVDANTIFDEETDTYGPPGRLQIISNKLDYQTVTTAANQAYVTDTNCMSDIQEGTLTFKLEFDNITDVGVNTGDYIRIVMLESDSAADIAYFYIYCNSGGDIATYNVYDLMNSEAGNSVTMTGIAINTQYDCYFYYKRDASVGQLAVKCGSWSESNVGNNNTTGTAGWGRTRFGDPYADFNGGTTATHIKFDDFNIYSGDQR